MFIATYQKSESEYQPPYDSHDLGRYSTVTVDSYTYLNTENELLAFMQKVDKSGFKTVKYFKIQEIYPKLNVTVDLTVSGIPPGLIKR